MAARGVAARCAVLCGDAVRRGVAVCGVCVCVCVAWRNMMGWRGYGCLACGVAWCDAWRRVDVRRDVWRVDGDRRDARYVMCYDAV